MYYLQSRYYNPEWGRFINSDAIAGQVGVLLSHNIFAYCSNNSINLKDDSGFMSFSVFDGTDTGSINKNTGNAQVGGRISSGSLTQRSKAFKRNILPKFTGKGEAGAQKTINIQKTNPYSNPKMRPKYGNNQVEEVWNYAKDIDGKVYDPNTGKELFWDKTKSRAGQWDMGHTPENKYSEWHKKYMGGQITKQEFLDWYRNPDNYRPESPSSNRSHLYK